MAAKATGYLELNLERFTASVNKAKKLLIGLGAAFISFKAGSAISDSISNAVGFGNEIYHLSEKLKGLGAGNAFLMQEVAEQLGLNVEQLAEAAERYASAGMKMEDVFRYNGSGNGLALALARAEKDHKGVADILRRRAMDFSFIADRLRAVSNKARDFWIGFADGIAVPLGRTVNMLASFDIAKFGKVAGEWIEPALNVINGLLMSDKPFQDLWVIIKHGFLAAADYVYDAIVRAARRFGEIIQEHLPEWMQKDKRESAPDKPEYDPSNPGSNIAIFNAMIAKLGFAGKYSGVGLANKPQVNHEAIKPFESYSVIGDSLQSIGGGGNYARTAMSVEARDAKHQEVMRKLGEEMLAAQEKTNESINKLETTKSK